MVAIAAPVMDGDGSYFAALGCHGPVQRSSLVDAEARKSMLFPAFKKNSGKSIWYLKRFSDQTDIMQN